MTNRMPTLLALPFQQDLHDIHPALRFRISDRAKRLALRLDPKTGAVFLVIPKRASMKKALEFASLYRDWIDKHATTLPDSIPFADGVSIPVLGRDRVIRVAYDESLKRTSITLTDNEILVSTNKDDPSQRITRFLKALAQEELTRIIREKSSFINKMPSTVQIRDTTSRWGSCSADGAISLSWRLILAPPMAMDYVVAHEMAHLIHMNHKSRFWALCEKLSTDFSTGHDWMKTNGQGLMRYGAT